MGRNIIAFLIIFMLSLGVTAQTAGSGAIGIDDSRLGTQIDMNMQFTSEDGTPITLKEAADGKPILLALVYYNCSSICSPFLNGVADMIKISPERLQPGRDYTVLTISFDPKEGHELAAAKKQSFLNLMAEKKTVDPKSWRFLTGNQENINKIAESVGFMYTPDGKEFKHASALIAISNEGTIARYMEGLDFLPLDVYMAVLDAGNNKWAPTIRKIVQFCFKADPQGRGYYFDILNVFGTMTLFGIFILIGTIWYLRRTTPEKSI